MGTGRFKDNKFDFTVVANFSMTAADWTAWERAIRKGSELFWNASEGQMSFGQVFVCDDSVGIDTAEMILHSSGDPSYATIGGYGQPGQALHLMPYVTTRGPLTILHEMGHHVWGLNEEYSQTPDSDTIDDTTAAPDNSTIPIVDSGRADNELAGKDALLKFGDLWERRTVTGNTATAVSVNPAYPELPTDSDSTTVWYQSAAECSEVANSNYCIMENSRDAAGYFDGAGTWIPAANPVTEYCTPSNHDPDSDTAQEDAHGKSCWEVIVERDEFSALIAPDPASGVEPADYEPLEWIVLDKQPRFTLVMDRSGSMSTGHKMADAQHGAVYWLEFCALGNDLLSIHWYDHAIEDIIPLTQVSTLGDLETQKNDINALTPRGSTNIRDGLYRGLDEIQSLPTRAAVQVALLLTDGIHNTPLGSSPSEVIPEFNEAGARIYALGVGDPAAVDMPTLDQLAEDTGGRSYAVGDDRPGEVEAAMVEINAEVRGGIITTVPSAFPDAKKSRADDYFAKHFDQLSEKDRRRHPPLEEVLKALRLNGLDGLKEEAKKSQSRIRLVPVRVEQGAQRVSFNLIYPQSTQVWLYLIDPDGNVYTGPRMNHVISDAPHEFAVVRRPKAGLWHMLAVRARPGGAFTLRAVAGIENKSIQVFGGATINHQVSGSVGVWATARFIHQLSGLRVTARIIDPRDQVHSLLLNDEQVHEPQSGSYQASFLPKTDGRHRGVLRVENLGKAVRANPLRLISHSTGTVDLQVKPPRFVREIPFYFDVGKREDPNVGTGDEVPGKRPIPRKRRTPLKSAWSSSKVPKRK